MRTQLGKKHIIWKVFLHTIWRFEKQSCWGLQQFSNLIQVYWNSVHLLLQNIIINWNIFENSTGKRNISFERSSYILFEGFKSNLVLCTTIVNIIVETKFSTYHLKFLKFDPSLLNSFLCLLPPTIAEHYN